MVLNPFPAGDGRPWTNQTFTTDSGVFSLAGLQNSAIAMHTLDKNNNNLLYVCTGTWAITNGAGGIATFTPSANDLLVTNPLGKPGLYKTYPVVTLSTGAVPMDSQDVYVVSEP